MIRVMDLYEHQGKELFARFAIPTTEGRVATTVDEARAAADALGGGRVVVKAQVLTGGRGKAGGVKLGSGGDEVAGLAGGILGLDINGHVTRRLWIEKAISIDKEYYFSITFDRGAKRPLFMLSTMGGMDIEAVAVNHPEALARLHLDPAIGLRPFFLRRLLFSAGIPREEHAAVATVVERCYRMFTDMDAMLVEVNPLVITAGGEAIAADAKVTIDDSSLFRHPDVAEMRDVSAADPQEQMARERDVTYVKLDGDIGILGNGAGLVMSTLDVVDQVGGSAANFLDVGGGADSEKIVIALEVIMSDPKVRAILFNIFGGITRCDEVARGVLAALDQMTIDVPIVVRLDGTNDVEGRELLADAAPPNVHTERTMLGAARRVVELAGS
jgi:succinyl-CoA synthetase beta subunit